MRARAGLSGRLGQLEAAAQAAAARRQGQEGRLSGLSFDYAQYTADFQAWMDADPEWLDRLLVVMQEEIDQWEAKKQTQGAVR